ncbi:hypothetical protein [Nitrosopumilus sp.]|uniref:hypothetical protein n=1 Tax=Nitrosopumilus sp. TaxID=2024843 RepID=UPI002931F4FE|nr:hypothetical protein [Nitrosopumilus sp.]
MSNDKREKRHEGFFEIVDNSMNSLNVTKKMFLFMIITAIVVPSSLLVGLTIAVEPSAESAKVMRQNLLLEQLKNGDISQEEYIVEMELVKDMPMFVFGNGMIIHLTIMGVALAWLVYGIRQWFVLTKWRKKYDAFKIKKKETDKILDEEFGDEG